MNMAVYDSRRSQQSANVKFAPIIKGLKSDIFAIAKEKSGVKNGWKLVPLRGGGGDA